MTFVCDLELEGSKFQGQICYYTPRKRSLGGYIGITPSVCLSVCSSVQSKLDLGYNWDKAFILHMWITCEKTFLSVPKILILWPWPWLLTYFRKKRNFGYNFWTKRERAFIFHMCISCAKTFLLEPNFFTLWPWPWLLTYFWKNLTLTITYEPEVIGF